MRNGAIVPTLAHGSPADYDVGEWARAVEERSGGSTRIEIESNWRHDRLDAETATIQEVRRGRVDLAKVPARAWNTVGVTSFDALLAPFLVTTYALERRLVSGDLGQKMLEGVERAGVVGLALLPGELQHPVGIRRDLIGPASYRGATVAVRSGGGTDSIHRPRPDRNQTAVERDRLRAHATVPRPLPEAKSGARPECTAAKYRLSPDALCAIPP
jgi:hypothetical protein